MNFIMNFENFFLSDDTTGSLCSQFYYASFDCVRSVHYVYINYLEGYVMHRRNQKF